MNKSKKTNLQVDSSYEKMPKALRKRTDLNSNQKLLYAYMLDKYIFFSSMGKEFFESGDSLAQELGISRRTVVNCLDGLIEKGLVVKNTRPKKGILLECIYEVRDIYSVQGQSTSVRHVPKLQEEEPEPF